MAEESASLKGIGVSGLDDTGWRSLATPRSAPHERRPRCGLAELVHWLVDYLVIYLVRRPL